ncbi:rapamycin complex subunit LST8 target [Colletotrichum scovillei]|uniref:Rapamycin complex subunit LST8 target n=1 Tax=Colletotrichum scovillei TaxID=1209932 RepID=A0A9P7RF72_9PEZI|nr:rapamycin complex subunit LST8 target [Colletotrichum scovillei]KAG7074728.1 rapamycin complex subunit LST8 target [Colletotrichum scovillei]KAG7081806.1 rapamycin complex subunit LST8 target [Colletotrichum scovillei]
MDGDNEAEEVTTSRPICGGKQADTAPSVQPLDKKRTSRCFGLVNGDAASAVHALAECSVYTGS